MKRNFEKSSALQNCTDRPKRNKPMENQCSSSSSSSFDDNLSKLPSDVVLHSILPHYILNLDRYAFLYNKHKYDLCLLFMGRFHNSSKIHLIFKNVSITTFKAIGRNGEVFNFFEKGILDSVLPSNIESISFLSNFFTQGTSISALPSIIMEKPLFLRHLNLTYQTSFKDVQQICSLKRLEHLRLANSMMSLQDVTQILKSNTKLRCLEYCFPHSSSSSTNEMLIDSQEILSAFQEGSGTLERLFLNGVSCLSNSMVAKLIEILPNLKELSVQDAQLLSNEAFCNIEKNGKNLTFINISGCENITCPFKTLLKAPKLRTIVLEGCDLSTKDLSITTKEHCTTENITDLDLASCVVNDMSILSNFSSLTCLNLSSVQLVAGSGAETFLKNIATLSHLKELNLTGCQFMNDTLLSHIANKELKMLRVGGCGGITDQSIPHLMKLEQLTEIEIGKTKISSGGVQSLLDHFKNIVYFGVNQLNLTDSDILNIQGWSQIERLNLSKNRISDLGFKSLVKYSNLIFLNLADNLITDNGIDQDLFSNKTLTGLILVANRKITNKKRSQIVMKCTHIVDLHL
ncbi:hypothetical protein C9374_011341 [Naegleria lovaniensis]|uniref:Uncharacterized protein n=1 Tax=Naegleria lovaniensis TaxID=51637 RepID=A0AA88KQN7_NAELO|nr:uncharacterized protein C9374_011341 [Naegleria lovaniensis]KAG2392616.1 hypothetical protein C9374_011341 [Naegleria lovaniensis]